MNTTQSCLSAVITWYPCTGSFLGHHQGLLCRVPSTSEGGSRVHCQCQVGPSTQRLLCNRRLKDIRLIYKSLLLPLFPSVEIYGRMSTDLLPTPAKSHYIFNLRDLSKCIQGTCHMCCNVYSSMPTFHQPAVTRTPKPKRLYYFKRAVPLPDQVTLPLQCLVPLPDQAT